MKRPSEVAAPGTVALTTDMLPQPAAAAAAIPRPHSDTAKGSANDLSTFGSLATAPPPGRTSASNSWDGTAATVTAAGRLPSTKEAAGGGGGDFVFSQPAAMPPRETPPK